jgi:glycosyl-4,4'-diaponeurosporenoate acyltransferase
MGIIPMNQRIAEWYFQPRAFETSNECAFYPRLGVRIYKRFVPTSGDWITRIRGVDRLKIATTGNRGQALKDFEHQTRKWELRHLISALLLESWAIIGGAFVGIEQLWASSLINLVVNVYPIMVQRYNRARMISIIREVPRPLESM